MDKKSMKGWLYLLPAIFFLGVFMVYPLIDVFIYSVEEGYNRHFTGTGPTIFPMSCMIRIFCRRSATRSSLS